MKIKCFVLGHKHRKTRYGFYEEVCSECGKHDYFDSMHADPGCRYITSIFSSYEFTIPQMLSIPIIWIRWKISNLFVRCNDCKKYERYLGFSVNDHSDCLPF